MKRLEDCLRCHFRPLRVIRATHASPNSDQLMPKQVQPSNFFQSFSRTGPRKDTEEIHIMLKYSARIFDNLNLTFWLYNFSLKARFFFHMTSHTASSPLANLQTQQILIAISSID